MSIASMNMIENQSNTSQNINRKQWLTTSETISYIERSCPLLWSREFRQLSARQSKLYKLAYEGTYGIESQSLYDHGYRLSRFYSKRSLDRANEVIQYELNINPFWDACSELEKAQNKLEDARSKLVYYANLVSELETTSLISTLERKKEKERKKSIQKDKDTLSFDADELHELWLKL